LDDEPPYLGPEKILKQHDELFPSEAILDLEVNSDFVILILGIA